MDDAGLPALFDPLLDYLSAHLPPQLYDLTETLLTHAYTLLASLLTLARTLLARSPFDAQQVLPPLITLLAAYLALVSFYRTTGWVLRTAFAFAKWGFVLSTLGAAAGYFLANADGPGGARGLGALGGGVLPAVGNVLLGLFGGQGQGQGAARRTGAGAGRGARGRARGRTQERPKAWDSWDKHRQWQYEEQYHAGGDEGANVQKIIGDIVGSAANAVRESGWWEAAKGAVEEMSKGKEKRETRRNKGKGSTTR